MFPFTFFVYLVLASASNIEYYPTHIPTSELIIHHNDDIGHCSFLSLRNSHIFKAGGIRSADGVNGYSDVEPAINGDSRLRFYAWEREPLWKRARELCGNEDSWNFMTLVDVDTPYRSGFPIRLDNTQEVLRSSGQRDLLLQYPPLEVEPLIHSGPSKNRVNLVFFSDGYLRVEKAKFLEDARRLAEDMTNNQTFATVKPLLNFWTAFSPSNESGVGVGGIPKDTPFGLYRDGTELRGVYYAKPEAARTACFVMGERCDFPILMGNDPLYGGLGGEFTVITPSLANGPLVLRHELGHSIIDVGEEYDGGFAYFGVNAVHDASSPVSWAHWLTSQHGRVERSVMPMQVYPWTLLNTSSPWTIAFHASGAYARHLVRFSLSGLPDARDLRVTLDGTDLGWEPRKDIGLDRWHYDVHRAGGLSEGRHVLSFELKNRDREGVAQMCSAEILEFGNEEEFNSTHGHYSLFPTFSLNNETSYRPTNEDCLMRIVTTPNLCKVCKEELWHALLKRIDLIDDVTSACKYVPSTSAQALSKWIRTVSLALVPLAQFRTGADSDTSVPKESYTIKWYKEGKVIEAFTNMTTLELEDEHSVGTYLIDVEYSTEEVRIDMDGFLISGGEFVVHQKCV